MRKLFAHYTYWLHTQWPAGTVEKLPNINEDNTCNVPGVYVVGDLTGIPLLKFSLDAGAKVVQRIARELEDAPVNDQTVLDLAIIGGGVSGMAAAREAQNQNLTFEILESHQPFHTIVNFPAGKPIYTYPSGMVPAGELQVSAEVKEGLLDELRLQTETVRSKLRTAHVERIEKQGAHLLVHMQEGEPLRARRVIVAIGRTGSYRTLDITGEDDEHVYRRLHDPTDFQDKNVLVVGGGDSALESTIALAQGGAHVTLSYRKAQFSRPKPENLESLTRLTQNGAQDENAPCVECPSSERVTSASGEWMKSKGEGAKEVSVGSLRMEMESTLVSIDKEKAALTLSDGSTEHVPVDAVFLMVGREAPLGFFRRSGIPIRGETSLSGWIALALFLLFCTFVYSWKGGAPTQTWLDPWPGNMPSVLSALGEWWRSQVSDRSTLIGTVAVSMKSRSFYYTFLYSLAVVVFGVVRIRRRKTPYVTKQTIVLMAIQVIPLFLLPEIVLPWMGYNGWFDHGVGRLIADNLFELYISSQDYLNQVWPDWGHPRAYWRAYGLILAWPLMVYNIFTESPMWWWICISVVQTFVIIPFLIYYWGKGAYCGWICSCGALAETVGDTQRHKMPHGPFWNRLNMAGQVVLGIAFLLLGLRVVGWMWPSSAAADYFTFLFEGKNTSGELVNYASYKWTVDVFLAGILGVGLYFKYSGRVWCRFFCPLAALMHVYARFTRFRIFAEKKKCISCNVCTSVCHQGIDVMNFANKGIPMEDPECVRCSACVQSCPTGVLSFGRYTSAGEVALDRTPASLVQINERRRRVASGRGHS